MKEININSYKNLFIISIFSFLPLSIVIGNLIFQLNLILIIISFISYFIKHEDRKDSFFDKNELRVFLILITYLIFNIFIAEDWTLSLRRNLFYFQFFLIIISFRYFLSERNIFKTVIKNWLIIILIVSFDIFFEYSYGYNILGFKNETGYTGRIASFFKDELIVGSFVLAFTIPIFSYFYINNKFKFSIFFILLATIAIIFSGERSSSLKILFGLILITYFWDYKNYLKKYILSLVAILFILISVTPIGKENHFIAHNIYHKYITTTLNSISLDQEKTFKENLMETRYLNQGIFSSEILKKNIFFGVGNKNYFKACRKYVTGYERNLCFTHPHQTYYELSAEHGLVGTFIIIYCLIYLIYFNQTKNLNNSSKKKLNIFRIYLILTFLPLIPSGSFFSTLLSSLFWINYTLYTIYRDKLIYEENN